MVDQSTRIALYMRKHCANKGQFSVQQASKIEVTIARSYTDDADVSHGVISTPQVQPRPGQRDDAINCTIAGLIPMI
jgi:hypothetical protein